MKKSNTAQRLKEIMELKNLKQVDILNIVENQGGYIAKSALSQYVNGKSLPDQEKLTLLANALDVNETWLMGYDVPMKNEAETIDNLFVVPKTNKKIPLLGEIAAGEPILAEEHIEEYIELETVVNADFCLRIQGDSMINANINDGDIVFIRQQPDVEDGEIAAVLIDNSATLKRVYKMKGMVQLRAENPKYEPIYLNGDKDVRILGKATCKLSRVI